MRQLRIAVVALLAVLASAVALSAQETVFEVEELNTGLPGGRDTIDLATPQSTMEFFLEKAEEKDWLAAAQALDLSEYDEDEQASVGPSLAQQLATILDRKVVISWSTLLERPDQMSTSGGSNDPMIGQARKSILLGLLELGDRSVAVRLNRLKPEDEPAVWVFSRQTVDNIPALFEEHGPTRIEQALPDWMRKDGPFDLRIWEWIALPAMALLVAAAAWFTYCSMGWLRTRTPRSIGQVILGNLRMPATLFVLSLVTQILTNRVFVVSGIVSNILEPLIVLGFVSALMVLIVNVIDGILDWMTPADVSDLTDPDSEESRSIVTTISAARRIVIVIAVLLGTGLVLASANVFQVIGLSLIASAGALTLIFGFAAREILGNIMASLQIALNRSARVGDQLIYDGELCTVERIHFTFVQLHVWDDTRLIVPVLKFVSEAFYNRNLVYPGMTRVVTLKLSNRINLDALRDRFETYIADRDAIETDDAEALVVGQDAHGIEIRFAIPVPNPTDGWDEEVALREAMIKAAQELEREQDDDLVPHMGLSPNPRLSRDVRAAQVPDDDD